MFNETEWQTKLATVMPALEGWCTPEKALKLVEVIITNHIHQVVEIGIYGGKSLIPMALAVQAVNPTSGNCYGIEAWSNQVAIEEQTCPENDTWWSKLDIILIKNKFLKYLTESSLAGIVRIIELPVTESLQIFKQRRYRRKIGLIHVDGNHSENQSVRDVKLAHSILHHNGVLVLDDIDWQSVAKAHRWIKNHGVTMFEAPGFGIYRIKKPLWRRAYEKFL